MTRNDLIARCSVVLVLGLGILATTGEVLRGIERWGNYDWDYVFFQEFSIYRSFFEFGELPFWNPWYMGGIPSVGNFLSLFPSPWFLLDILAGPIASIKLRIVAQQVIGVAAMYWMARGFRMSRLAAVYVSGTFFFSSWLALRVHSGHLSFLSTAFLPLLVGLFARARSQPRVVSAFGSGAILALMILPGGIYDVIFASFVLSPLTLIWCLQDRSARPLLYAVMVGAWALGFSAVKLFPVLGYMRENPRTTEQGGTGWRRIMEKEDGSSADAAAPQTSPAEKTGVDASAKPKEAKAVPRGPVSKLELPKFVLRIFLGREQRSNSRTYSPLQGFGWQEYGAYIGPLAIILALAGPLLAFRQSWPWLLVASVCFVTGAGNFSPYSPWTLIHNLPVFKSMHCPSRLLIPCIFTASIAAGFALDALRAKLAGSHPQRLDVLLGLLVAAALIDSVIVFRYSIKDAFPKEPPITQPRPPSIVTIKGEEMDMTIPMLANKCTAAGYEPSEPKVWVQTSDSLDYHGETYFRPDAPNAPIGKAELVTWTPNTVTVRATCPAAGSIVLNRNWYKGWRADAPYSATSLDGLISAHVEPGEHVIRFVFVPSEFWLGSSLSLVTIALAGTLLFRQTRSRREFCRAERSESQADESR